MPIAQQSKFACLKVEDDTSVSEDEGQKLMNLGKNQKNIKKNVNQKSARKGNGPLIVHVIPQKPKSKGKKNKKAPQIVVETGLVIQDASLDPAEMKYREELRQALKESYESSSLTTQRNTESSSKPVDVEKVEEREESKETPAEYLILELDNEAKKACSGAAKTADLAAHLYRTKLLSVLGENSRLNEDLSKAQANTEKYRRRYTKLCEILKDVEINEKAQLVVQLEKARQIEIELGNQIGTLRGELMQATSKNREYEAKIKELAKR